MVDKKHPLYNEYESKFKEIWERYDEEKNAIPDSVSICLDSPRDAVDKKRHLAIKKLQEEYSFLFIDHD